MSWFIPHNKKLYRLLVNLSSPIRYGLTIVLLGSFVGSWYYLLYLPAKQAIDLSQNKIKTLLQKKTSLPISPTDLIAAQQEHEELEKKVSQRIKIDNHQSEGSVLLVVNTARKSGLIVQSCESITATNVPALMLNAHGTYEQISAFFDLLFSHNKQVGCRECSIMQTSENQLTLKCTFNC